MVATSGTSTPYVLNGATSPKFVRRPDSQVSDVSSPPQTTYLVPQNGSSQLVPYYNSEMPSDSSIQRNHAASDAPVQPENFRPSIQREYEGKEKATSSHNAAVNPSTLQDRSADFPHRTAPNSNELSQVSQQNTALPLGRKSHSNCSVFLVIFKLDVRIIHKGRASKYHSGESQRGKKEWTSS